MTADPVRSPLLLLAGTSEAGKSSAGQFLAAIGAHRVKIRPILLGLASGTETRHEGVATREGFDHHEFVEALLNLPVPADTSAIVVESFIDVALAETVRRAWPARCAVVFITAPRSVRVHRLAAALHLDVEQAACIVRHKDTRKRVDNQLPAWRTTADHWIENVGDLVTYRTSLREILRTLTAPPEGDIP